MNSSQVEKNLEALIANFSQEEFIFDLLLAYGIPKATVTLLKKGRHNLAKEEGQVVLKNKLFFQRVENRDLHEAIDSLQKDSKTMKQSPRFIIVTDFKTLLAVDTKTQDHLDIPIQEVAKNYDFFLPWAGIEKHKHKAENPADRKAAEKMAKLYDRILEENDIQSDSSKTHDLNIFLSRLLFCFFAEDTNIFQKSLFTDSVASHTRADGSDLSEYLKKFFEVLNMKDEERDSLPEHFKKFPYVNGGLFKENHWIPNFSAKSHRIMVECGELNWAEINPDIFGSMIQAVTHPGDRASLGMHYTSVPNIMKVIEPLFLNDLREEFEKNKGNKKKLDDLRIRMSKIKFFDPACGSGNFLIITYKALRRLEMEIIQNIGAFSFSDLSLSQFYGIEIDDFAHEIAKLSLYLAEHQMNVEFKTEFGDVRPTLPLRESGNIVCANATRVAWEEVCPKEENDEIYILGNPPYLGTRNQELAHKNDMEYVFCETEEYRNLDYIACWFFKGSKYINLCNAKLAFVSTNSICQGEQVALLWPRVLGSNLEIGFAHTSFKWKNNAKGNAGVTVIIVGLRNISKESKFLLTDSHVNLVPNISPYLTAGATNYVVSRSKSLSKIPEMRYGNYTGGCNDLILTAQEKESILKSDKNSQKFIRRFVGSLEFIRGKERYCLWISNDQLSEAESNIEIKNRIEKVKQNRLKAKDIFIQKLASRPHQFRDINESKISSIIVPITSSEKREYIPCGFLDKDCIIPNSGQAIYDAEPWIFGIVSSRMHMTWVRAVAGRLKTDYRYSSALCYNTFPIASLTAKQKEEITQHVYTVLEEREKHSQKTMAQLYDPDKMPEELRKAHHALDLAVERIYRSRPFTSDEERLEYLFSLYERMIEEEKVKNNK